MTNIVNDLSTLTTISTKALTALLKKEIYCVCEAVEEDLLEEKTISELNIGIGALLIKLDDKNNVKYKFIPSKYLNDSIKNTIINKQNLLEDVLIKSLNKKFEEVYKNLC